MPVETLTPKTVQVAAVFGTVVVRITTPDGGIYDMPLPDPEAFRKAIAKAMRDAKRTA